MSFSVTARNEALDGIPVDRVSLHSGDPGTTGANYLSAGGRQAATFGAAASGERFMTGDVNFTGLGAAQSVTHYGVWQNAGTVYKFGAALVGDLTANAAGEYLLKGTTTKMNAV